MSASIIINEYQYLNTVTPEYFMKQLKKYTDYDLHRGQIIFDKHYSKLLKRMYSEHRNFKDCCGFNPFRQLLDEYKKRKFLLLKCEY